MGIFAGHEFYVLFLFSDIKAQQRLLSEEPLF